MTQPTPVEKFSANVAQIARARHTAKAYRPAELTEAQVSDLLDLLRFSASSVNIQPWHLIVATTPEGRDRVAKAGADENYAFNAPAMRNAGMTVIFAGRQDVDDAYLTHLLDVEDASGRFPTPDNRAEMEKIRSWFVDLSRDETGSAREWMARQVYWNGGQFLLGAAAMGLDATPMEGIDAAGLDAEFGLKAMGYTSLFAVTVGHNQDEDDWNFGLPKSRLSLDEITTRI